VAVLVFALIIAQQEPAPVRVLDDSIEHPRGGFITYPTDAVLSGSRLYVAAGDAYVLVFEGERPLEAIGGEGSGPGEFEHPPERLELIGDQLAVTERYGWRRHFFTRDGEYVRTEHREKSGVLSVGGRSLEKLLPEAALARGFRLEAGDCGFAPLAGEDHLDYHHTEHVLSSLGSRLFIAARRGHLWIYDQCALVDEVRLDLTAMSREPIEDRRTTDLHRSRWGGTFVFYRYGTPIEAIAAESATRCWLLVRDERQEGRFVLIRLETDGPARASYLELTEPATSLRVMADSLILIDREAARIRVHEIESLIPALVPMPH